jgi:N-acetylneuraminate lyase
MNGYSRFLTGLVAAPHTPMTPDGAINPAVVARQAGILIANGISGAFICGSTGESHSLTTAERMAMAQAWRAAIGSRRLKLIVHAGHNSLEDARALAAHAASIQADAISIMAPCYYKPASVDDLVGFCAPVAAAAPALPFYFYDIPSLTGVHISMPEFLKRGAARIPNLAGLKFTTSNFMALQQCLAAEHGRFNILFGVDEMLLGALALGVHGAVGSTYNYAAPLYRQIIDAFDAGHLAQARTLQLKSVQLVEVLCHYGVLPGGKALMSLLGADCGPVRPPVRNLTPDQLERLFTQVKALGVLSAPMPASAQG